MTDQRACQTFEDILDGYFPLGESLHQCLHRNGFGAALIVMTHAPILDLADRPVTAPVPLRLGGRTSGLVRRLMIVASAQGDIVRGRGEWSWHDGQTDRPLTENTRLAEPAFIRGIGLRDSLDTTETLWQVTGPEGRSAWGFSPDVSGIASFSNSKAGPVYSGQRLDETSEALELRTSDTLDALIRDWAD